MKQTKNREYYLSKIKEFMETPEIKEIRGLSLNISTEEHVAPQLMYCNPDIKLFKCPYEIATIETSSVFNGICVKEYEINKMFINASPKVDKTGATILHIFKFNRNIKKCITLIKRNVLLLKEVTTIRESAQIRLDRIQLRINNLSAPPKTLKQFEEELTRAFQKNKWKFVEKQKNKK